MNHPEENATKLFQQSETKKVFDNIFYRNKQYVNIDDLIEYLIGSKDRVSVSEESSQLLNYLITTFITMKKRKD